MAMFLITYDLHKQRNYEQLYKLLHLLSAVRLTESVWLARLVGPAPEVRRHIVAACDNDDGIAVIELKPDSDWATTRGVYSAGTDWLEANL